MKKNALWVLFLFVFCNQLPIGEEQLRLRGDFTLQYIELFPTLTLTESKNIPLGTSANLILAKNDDYESRILMRFDFPSSIEEGLDEIKLILFRNSNFTNSTLKFSIHLLDDVFEETEATWHRRTDIEGWFIPGGDFEEDSIRFAEIDGDSVVIYFNYIELEDIKNAPGLIIIPEDTGFVHFYSKEGGTAPKFHLIKNEAVTTVTLEGDCHILAGPEPFYIESWIGSGMAYRNYTIFNFDTLFVDNDNKKAIFAELTVESAQYFGRRDSVEIAVRELIEPFDDFATPMGQLIALKRYAIDDTLFRIDLVKHVQRIIDYPDSNFGFFIYLSPENYDIANIQFVTGSHRLTIGYILPPDER